MFFWYFKTADKCCQQNQQSPTSKALSQDSFQMIGLYWPVMNHFVTFVENIFVLSYDGFLPTITSVASPKASAEAAMASSESATEASAESAAAISSFAHFVGCFNWNLSGNLEEIKCWQLKIKDKSWNLTFTMTSSSIRPVSDCSNMKRSW